MQLQILRMAAIVKKQGGVYKIMLEGEDYNEDLVTRSADRAIKLPRRKLKKAG